MAKTCHKATNSDNCIKPIENNFRFLANRSLTSRQQYTMAYEQKAPSCDPLSSILLDKESA